MGALLAPVAAHAHVQNRGTPPVRFVRQAPDYRVTRLALAPAAATPPILTNDAACQHCMVWPHALASYFQAQVIQARERAQVGAIKGSIGHVEVFRMDGVGISIIERPRPLHNHDTPNPTHHTYTLKCEEPVRLFAFKGVGGVGVGRSGPECRWWRGRRAHPAASRAQVRMEGCGGEWFGVPVPRLFLFVGALHPIRRQCTSSVRVHRHVTGAPPRNGCSAPVLVAVVAAVGVAGVFCA